MTFKKSNDTPAPHQPECSTDSFASAIRISVQPLTLTIALQDGRALLENKIAHEYRTIMNFLAGIVNYLKLLIINFILLYITLCPIGYSKSHPSYKNMRPFL